MAMHDGHRRNLRERYLQEGLDNFNEINALELLLFYCIPRRDTNPIAHNLLDRFKTLPNVLDASKEELMEVEGVGEGAALFLSMIRDISRYYFVKKNADEAYLMTLDECGRYLCSRFIGRQNEVVYLLCLDAKCKVLGCRQIGEGSVNSAGISIRKVVSLALNTNATTVVLAHNHPGGFAVPSDEDVVTTYRIKQALNAVDIILADHIVVSGEDYVSMVQSNYFNPREDACAMFGGSSPGYQISGTGF